MSAKDTFIFDRQMAMIALKKSLYGFPKPRTCKKCGQEMQKGSAHSKCWRKN